MNAAPGDTWPCPICREQIPKGAKKCIRCQSELRWRRYLVFSSTTLALLTALISVIASSAPTIKSLFEVQDSDIRGIYVATSSPTNGRAYYRVNLFINNEGSRTGAVTGGTLQCGWKHGFASSEIRLTTSDHLPIFIAGKETKPIAMEIASQLTPNSRVPGEDMMSTLKSLKPRALFSSEEEYMDCWITLDVIKARGEFDDRMVLAPCGDLAPPILTAIEKSKIE